MKTDANTCSKAREVKIKASQIKCHADLACALMLCTNPVPVTELRGKPQSETRPQAPPRD